MHRPEGGHHAPEPHRFGGGVACCRRFVLLGGYSHKSLYGYPKVTYVYTIPNTIVEKGTTVVIQRSGTTVISAEILRADLRGALSGAMGKIPYSI